MPQTAENNSPTQTFVEGTANAFDGNTHLYKAVQMDVSETNGVELYDGGQKALGVNYGKLHDSTPDVTVRLFGQGGTFKIKAAGVIAQDAYVTLNSSGLAIAWTNEAFIIGIKRSSGNSAANDVIEVIDRFSAGMPAA